MLDQHPQLKKLLIIVALVCVVVGFSLYQTSINIPDESPSSSATSTAVFQASASTSDGASTDAQLAQLFQEQASNVEVSGSGTVSRILADDDDGSRHQRFILELDSGQTLLVAHNIDIAPRLDGLQVGDQVGFYGEYVYSDQGGTIHWTHHDPQGQHVAGWLEWKGQRYQ